MRRRYQVEKEHHLTRAASEASEPVGAADPIPKGEHRHAESFCQHCKTKKNFTSACEDLKAIIFTAFLALEPLLGRGRSIELFFPKDSKAGPIACWSKYHFRCWDNPVSETESIHLTAHSTGVVLGFVLSLGTAPLQARISQIDTRETKANIASTLFCSHLRVPRPGNPTAKNDILHHPSPTHIATNKMWTNKAPSWHAWLVGMVLIGLFLLRKSPSRSDINAANLYFFLSKTLRGYPPLRMSFLLFVKQ
jgi:hypothetical protein